MAQSLATLVRPAWVLLLAIVLTQAVNADALAADNASAFLATARNAVASHEEVRRSVIVSQAALARPGGVLILGDSILEALLFPCPPGSDALNAAIAGAGMFTYDPTLLGMLLDRARPSVVVVALGVNDMHLPPDVDREAFFQDWKARCRELLRQSRQHEQRGVMVLCCTILPVERHWTEDYFDQAMLLRCNAAIRELAAEEGAALLDGFALHADGEGFLPPGRSQDGLHPGPDMQRIWREQILQALVNMFSTTR